MENGVEFCNTKLHNLLEAKEIQYQLTLPHLNWQNGGLECVYRSFQKKKKERFTHWLSYTFISMVWSPVCATYLLNYTSSIGHKNSIPYNKYHDIKINTINIDHLRVFDYTAYATLPIYNRDCKLIFTAVKCIMAA